MGCFVLTRGEKGGFCGKSDIFCKNFQKIFGGFKFLRTFAIPNGKTAEVAQLVEHNLAKVGVASSSLVFRSKTTK